MSFFFFFFTWFNFNTIFSNLLFKSLPTVFVDWACLYRNRIGFRRGWMMFACWLVEGSIGFYDLSGSATETFEFFLCNFDLLSWLVAHWLNLIIILGLVHTTTYWFIGLGFCRVWVGCIQYNWRKIFFSCLRIKHHWLKMMICKIYFFFFFFFINKKFF